MGKSARSKSKIRNRNVLRATVFGPREAERIQRLAAKQQVVTGNIGDLMDADEPVTKTQTDSAKTQTAETPASGDVTMRDASKRKKHGGKRKVQRIIVRNKKGRILSKTQVAWVKQSRCKK
ncbi:hypothetical protein GGH12_000393 [Coemansia sp. RSA 1822]|nr:hypothetical protein LPJ76_006186 [Coemansia sp. RSA 638]KAJ2482423.1 hypothetical protein IWW56_001081 [Coemansia sp. RSA 2131]KAJ2543373.1 hypothetical protein GGF49_002158 [Coemansia sp. RSA 1853]KAJ2567280.1 hypothetical protein GGH12_000393 [Coemansia sp. RSA 1822]KAJ2665778.1 hypothetical protein IW148_001537 [Coemansia sp. RSA 1199]